ncbi:MAG: hypothetical protein CL623_11115 [Arcobacter sp.]|nr:hypothetical protein [Arcobacter sp.]|tara:strand:- start:3747 stop:5111 length:1365 start_codon:yes stop_codon:yes gene_type:complete
MRGRGFELQKVLDENENYFPKLSLALKRMVITSGPWIISICTLLIIKVFLTHIITKELFTTFISIIIYAFIFSIIITSPFINIITRYISDKIYLNERDKILPTFFSSLILIALISFISAVLFIQYNTNLQEFKIDVAYLFTALSILWLIMAFVSTLKDYDFVTYSFLIGMIISFILLYFVWNIGLSQLLQSLTMGILFTISLLIARIMIQFTSDKLFDFSFLFVKKYYLLFFSNLFLYLGLWIDKFLYWISDKGEEVIKGFYFFADYDFIVFLAYLTLIPTTAYITVYIETVFHENQKKYSKSIENKERLSNIKIFEERLKKSFFIGLIKTAVFQFSLAILFVLIVQFILDSNNINVSTIPLLRITIFAVSIQMLINVLVIFLYYFDFQKEVLFIAIFFLLSNFIITVFMVNLPYEYVGYSYFISTLLTFVLSLFIVLYKIEKINFYTFINNEV